MTYDVAIIGSGFAGLVATMLASNRGLNFIIIAKDYGATQHFSGAFDFVDAGVSSPLCNSSERPTPAQAYENFLRSHPHHIYARLNFPAAEILAAMRRFFSFYQIPVFGDGERFVSAISVSGQIKPACFTLPRFGLGQSDFFKAAVVVHFPFLTDYPTELIVRNLQKNFSSVRSVSFTGFAINRTSPLSSLRRFMESTENRQQLWHFLREHHGSLIVLPPILSGACDSDELSCVQMLCTLPSLAGEQVKTSVLRTFAQKKIKLVQATVCGTETRAGRVEKIFLKETGEVITAQKYVLATGKFVGGGISSSPDFKETVFALPLQALNTPISPQTRMEQLINDFPDSPQPFMQLGVSIESSFKNLSICGQVVSGFDFTRERNGFGVSVATAMRALQAS